MSDWQHRFRRYYSEGDPSACWEWRGALNVQRRGRLSVDGKQRAASRLAYELAFGAIPPGMCVCHRCDNPPCVNPGHLFLGTHADNMRDRNAKGRARGGSLRGEKHPLAVLTRSQAEKIRELALRQDVPQSVIARQFGISQSHVSEIKNAKCW